VKVSSALANVLLATFLISLSACAGRTPPSSASALPDFTAKSKCERDGLFWHANLGICEKI